MGSLLTAQEVAEMLNLSVDTVWRYTRQKRIPVMELGKKQYRYEKEAVLAALTTGKIPAEDLLVKEETLGYAKQGEYTYEDYVRIPDEPGYRFEVLEGMLIREPSPTTHHQRVVFALSRQLADFFECFDPEGELFIAPLDITLTSRNVVQPDILFISGSRRSIMRPERIDGPCDLVVEVMSPSNRRKDRLRKLEIYRRAGIPHYWLVDPEENTLEAFMLKDERYVLAVAGGPGDMFDHPDFPGLDLDLIKVFYKPAYE
ncbi:Uma2 family endonuclease [Desulfitobacterium chlororespirans]|uniref:DNA binding domain-containing protein, excisionase family n=1 Tax=Desulfitobacterium chlororespirans DSM 11544 TaxID=1121395 RepID=A0A1M7SFY2_9FIRM|nr:Uma2 family endonuclease [Desulfitobacterium chlororespirans]SHN57399.1 DNA binding domain-containing protein, excisionase family [Desulfitobacterium chlororespirans DSM 11544]